MRAISDGIRQAIIDLKAGGHSNQVISDTLGVSISTIKRTCRGRKFILSKRRYKSLKLMYTDTGIEYIAGYTTHGHYVEMDLDSNLYFTEAGIWIPGKDPNNCRSACRGYKPLKNKESSGSEF